jgi:hypothetical protein
MLDIDELRTFDWIRALKFSGGAALASLLPGFGFGFAIASGDARLLTALIGLVMGLVAMFVIWAKLLAKFLKAYPPPRITPAAAIYTCMIAIDVILAVLSMALGGANVWVSLISSMTMFLITLAITWAICNKNDSSNGNTPLSPAVSPASPPAAIKQSVPAENYLDQLVKLKRLHDAGAITDAQFDIERSNIMQRQWNA